MWAIIVVSLILITVIMLEVAHRKGRIRNETFQRYASITGIIGLPLALLVYLVPISSPPNSTQTPSPTPTPSIAPTPSPTQTASINTQAQKEVTEEPNPQTIKVDRDRTGSAFKGDVSIGVNGIPFGGDPLRNTVNATIRSPGHKPYEVKNLEINKSVQYKGGSVYDITLIEVDTFWAKFEIRRVDKEGKTTANVNSAPK